MVGMDCRHRLMQRPIVFLIVAAVVAEDSGIDRKDGDYFGFDFPDPDLDFHHSQSIEGFENGHLYLWVHGFHSSEDLS